LEKHNDSIYRAEVAILGCRGIYIESVEGREGWGMGKTEMMNRGKGLSQWGTLK
jgi:hypothetical protein